MVGKLAAKRAIGPTDRAEPYRNRTQMANRDILEAEPANSKYLPPIHPNDFVVRWWRRTTPAEDQIEPNRKAQRKF